MTTPRPRAADPECRANALDDLVEDVNRATLALSHALRARIADQVSKPAHLAHRRVRPALVKGGVVLVTDDGRGVARAVAADLRALGYRVVRVRHGVGDADVEGVNLTAAAAVAALVDRVRSHGPIAAIVHLAPVRSAVKGKPDWAEPDDARSLALLAQAASDDLLSSAVLGGSCLIVARHEKAGSGDDRLSRWVDISIRTLKGVRVRGLDLDRRREPEVLAAEVVRATLGTDSTPSTESRPLSHAILLGAPDRAAWMHLAATLGDWLDDAPEVRLADLAFTLHGDQPAYPFRVGLVARTGRELASRLRRAIAELAEPARAVIHDLGGTYCVDQTERGVGQRRPSAAAHHWSGRLRGLSAEPPPAPGSEPPDLEALADWTGRDWSNHLIALRFARDGRLVANAIREGGASVLDLSVPPQKPSDDGRYCEIRERAEGSIMEEALDALDHVIAVRRELLSTILSADQ